MKKKYLYPDMIVDLQPHMFQQNIEFVAFDQKI